MLLPLAGVSPAKSLDLTSRCSSGVEHFLGKEEVVSSILINGSVIFFVAFRIELERILP